MKLNKFITRSCGKCKKPIGKAWQGGDCPNCGASLDKWGVKVEPIVRCPQCNAAITGREMTCPDCGHQMPSATLQHEQ